MPYLARVALVLGCISVFVAALAHAGSFIIELTNGREMTTSHVWEEGDEIKFYASQGTAGIPKALVKRIRTADRVHHDQVSRSALASSALMPRRRRPTGHPPRANITGPKRARSEARAHSSRARRRRAGRGFKKGMRTPTVSRRRNS